MLNFANKNDYEALVESAIIDLRSKSQFSEGHIKYSCNIESTSLESRVHELPESRQIVSIIGEQSDLLFASDFLTSKGYKILFQIEAASFFKIYSEHDWFESVHQRQMVGDSRLAWAVLIGTIPVGLAGLLLGDFVEAHLRSPLVIAATTIIFALLLAWADWYGKQQRTEHQLTWQDIFIVGVAQAIALIPGTSRSGITITAGLILGLSREAAARFSFLLSIPVIFLAGGLKALELIQSNLITDWFALISGAILSAVSAYICIHLFLKLLAKIGMWPFVIYRLVLGVILIAIFI